MLKVVIVDDEPSVLEGLRIFADWNNAGFEIVGEASDGRAALPVIMDMQPDLVICDIRMPGMTGLELIERVSSKMSPVPKFLMLSGYNDFSYAQKALQFGAVGYMTKPVDPEELSCELSRAAGIIEHERSINRENLELIRYTANQLYNDVINGRYSEKLKRKADFIFGIPENSKMRIIHFITLMNNKKGHTFDPAIYDLILGIIGIENENAVFYNGNGCYVIIMHEGMRNFTSHTAISDMWSGYLGENDLHHLGLRECWVLVSGMSCLDILENFSVCTKQLDHLHIYCMLHPEHHVICYDALRESSGSQQHFDSDLVTVLPELLYDNIVDAIKGSERSRVTKAIEEFFSELDRNVGSDMLFSVCLYRLADIVRKTASTFGIEADKAILGFTSSVGVRKPNCKNLAQAMCAHVFDKLNNTNDKSIALLENEIIEYIKSNFCIKNISIQSIAEKFSLPPMIISKMVKNRTKRKFNDYINYLRIEYAQTLFASEDMKITAVCDESGYSDYGYFIKKFKEYAGMLPSDYKKRYS